MENLKFLAKQGVMLSFDEIVSRTYEMKKRDVRIRTKHHDMRGQKTLVSITGIISQFNSFLSHMNRHFESGSHHVFAANEYARGDLNACFDPEDL